MVLEDFLQDFGGGVCEDGAEVEGHVVVVVVLFWMSNSNAFRSLGEGIVEATMTVRLVLDYVDIVGVLTLGSMLTGARRQGM